MGGEGGDQAVVRGEGRGGRDRIEVISGMPEAWSTG